MAIILSYQFYEGKNTLFIGVTILLDTDEYILYAGNRLKLSFSYGILIIQADLLKFFMYKSVCWVLDWD